MVLPFEKTTRKNHVARNSLWRIWETARVSMIAMAVTLFATPLFSQDFHKRGLILQLDASDISANGSSKTNIPNVTRVSLWKDKSGQGNHINQLDKTRQPQLISNGIGKHVSVRFNGQSVLQRNKFAGLKNGDAPFHLFIVMQAGLHPSHRNQRLLDFSSIDTTKPKPSDRVGFWIGYQGNGRNRLGIHNGDEGEAKSVAWSNRPVMIEVVYHGAQNWRQFLNGTADGQGTFGSRTFLGFRENVRLSIGQHFGIVPKNTFLKGDIAEILMYDRPLKFAEQNSVGSYLTRKYGLKTNYGPLPNFEKDIRPILVARCFKCHSGKSPQGELDLRTVSAMLQGGGNGPAVIRGYPQRSELITKIESGEMPPKGKNRLSKKQVAMFRRWVHLRTPANEKIVEFDPASLITQKDRQHWAYQKLVRRPVPRVKNQHRVRTPIDSFIFHRLEEQGISISPEARRRTLVRRAFFDLIGLPPSPEEIKQFINDTKPDAWERLINRLLASPHFGERWGRHWLDAAGYVDVYGGDNDAATIQSLVGKWRFRDYVVAAYNQDKPFDRFLIQQLAGDELYDWRTAKRYSPEMTESLIATGFLLSAADSTHAPELNTPDVRHRVLQVTGEIVSRNLFALTAQCAKCHDHKYEAIPQHDYYRFLATFNGVFNPERWVVANAHGIPDVPNSVRNSIDQHNRKIDAQIKTLQQQQKVLKKSGTAQRVKLDRQISQLKQQRKSYGTIQVAYEKSSPSASFVLRRGNHLKPMREVQAGLFSVLSERRSKSNLNFQPAGSTSGRRLEFAKQITDGRTIAGGLIARVRMNRLWQQLFGRGIVATSDNFGISGSKPSHPQLLDWLASEFIRSGWRFKPLVKRIMMSSVYRQSSRLSPQSRLARQKDPANSLLWRMPLRRLPSEIVRDHLLAVSGKLNRKLGGKPLSLKNLPSGEVVLADTGLTRPQDKFRRSLYVLARRNYQLSLLSTFDQPIVATNCTQRTTSAVVTQSLTMLNAKFVLQQADGFAKRVANLAGMDSRKQVNQAYLIAFGRPPVKEERRLCLDLLTKHKQHFLQNGVNEKQASADALAQLCHTLLNTNEFLYIP